MATTTLYEALEDWEDLTAASGPALLARIKSRYGIEHVAYLGLNIPHIAVDEPYITATYPDDWVTRYLEMNYIEFDPVVTDGLRGILPLDWNTVRNGSRKIRHFFEESREFGLAKQGLSIPVHGAHGDTGLFTVNVDHSDHAWLDYLKEHQTELHMFASYLHLKVLSDENVSFDNISLTTREREVLKMIASGLTRAHAADRLGISTKTVDFHLANTLEKTRTSNVVQAVAKCVRAKVI